MDPDALNQARFSLLGTQMKPMGVLGVDDALLKHYGHHFEQIACLYDHVDETYVWAHNLVTVHYSDDMTDYPVQYQLWKPMDVDRVEHGLMAAGIKLKDSKQPLKADAPHEWRQYLLGVWQRHQHQPEVVALYDSKLRIAEHLLQQWVTTHHVRNFGKVRLVINYRQPDLTDNPVFYITNRLVWQAAGITRIRRHRWPVEVYAAAAV